MDYDTVFLGEPMFDIYKNVAGVSIPSTDLVAAGADDINLKLDSFYFSVLQGDCEVV